MTFNKLIEGMKEMEKKARNPDKKRYLKEARETLINQKETIDKNKAELERLRDMKTISFLE
jgi:uncharacterized protein (DUF342 family)